MTTTYADIESRRVAIPLGVIEYSQAKTNTYTDRRSDCSGLISYVWNLRTSGAGTWLGAFTTQSLWEQGLIKEITRAELRPGDAIGYCGPNTANGGGGHIALYQDHDGDSIRVWDHGSGMGPKDRWVTWNAKSTGWLSPGRCKAWRYVDVQEDDMRLWLITDPAGQAWLCDGIRRRKISPEQLGTVKYVLDHPDEYEPGERVDAPWAFGDEAAPGGTAVDLAPILTAISKLTAKLDALTKANAALSLTVGQLKAAEVAEHKAATDALGG